MYRLLSIHCRNPGRSENHGRIFYFRVEFFNQALRRALENRRNKIPFNLNFEICNNLYRVLHRIIL